MSDEWDGPELIVGPCECGAKDCRTVIVAMLRPVIKPTKESIGTDKEELSCMLHLPIDAIQSVVDTLVALAANKGVRIR